VLEGGRTVSVAAPANQIPLFVRSGAVLPLLPSDVATLSSYGSGVVHLNDRPDRRALLAWPARGVPASTATHATGATVQSGAHGDQSWMLRVDQRRRRTFDLQVTLPQRPCELLVNAKRHSFSYSDGVLRAAVALTSGTVQARASCGSR
jgi:alpha-glucosidase (family GH31 glycosyl hydrolase)